MNILAIVLIAGMTAGFAASVALLLRRLVPGLSPGSRRVIAPISGALMAMSPAFMAAARESGAAVVQVALLSIGLTLIAGYPAVRFFDSTPKA